MREIVGIAADVRSAPGAGWFSGRNALATPVPPIIYVPVAQVPDALLAMVRSFYRVSWSVRVRAMDSSLIPAIQAIVGETQPRLPFVRFTTMEEVVGQAIQTEGFHMTLIGSSILCSLSTMGAS